jgi:hypothetical protein
MLVARRHNVTMIVDFSILMLVGTSLLGRPNRRYGSYFRGREYRMTEKMLMIYGSERRGVQIPPAPLNKIPRF